MSRWRAIPLFQRVLLVIWPRCRFPLRRSTSSSTAGSAWNTAAPCCSGLFRGNHALCRPGGWEGGRLAVSPRRQVTYRFDGGDYGPYIVVEDPGAVPDHDMADVLTGVEVRRGDEILFRGGWLDGGISVLIDESGAPVSPLFSFSWHAGGKAYGPDGQEMDFSHEPSVSLSSHSGAGARPQAPGGHIPVLAGHLSGRRRHFHSVCRPALPLESRIPHPGPELAEPSDWELFGRRLGWIV